MKSPEKLRQAQLNRLLGAFAPEALARLTPYLEPVDLALGETVCDAGGPLTHAYFPQGCVLSLLTVMENGAEIECANIGREGAFGLFTAMSGTPSTTRCLTQLAGAALRCEMAPLRAAFQSDRTIQDLFTAYAETILSQIAQTAGCNALHTIEQRMCRWMLMMHDRAEGDQLTYTHEFLARVMGANRTSITHAAQKLQRRGFITYRRGLMRIEDRPGMERAACECYAVVKRRADAFPPPFPPAPSGPRGQRGAI